MAQKTPNYNLNKPGYEDFGDVDMLNENFEKIDKVLAATDPTKVPTKAEPADGDGVMIADSADGGKAKRLLWSNGKTALEQVFGDARTTVSRHIADKSNPHEVTAEQIGAVQATTEMISSSSTVKVPESTSDINAMSPGVYGWVGDTRLEWMPEELSGALTRYELTVHNTKYKNQNLTLRFRCIDGSCNLREFIGEGITNGIRWTEIITTRSGADYTVHRAKHQSLECESDVGTTYLRDAAFDTSERTPSANGTIIWQYG